MISPVAHVIGKANVRRGDIPTLNSASGARGRHGSVGCAPYIASNRGHPTVTIRSPACAARQNSPLRVLSA